MVKLTEWEEWVANVHPPVQKYASAEYISNPDNWGPPLPSYKEMLQRLTVDELLRLYLQVDANSPSGLSWRRKLERTTGPASKIREGTPALVTPIKSGKGYTYWGGKAFNKPFAAHRVVYFLETGTYPPVIDHINQNPMDNCVGNLRASTHVKNQQNRRRGQSKGFYWNKAAKAFYVRVGSEMVSTVQDMLTARADYVRAYLTKYGHYPSPE